ncbi:fibronectin type III domain-containing protein [Actinacidiphila soli]|uniref:fibronectin type III domain-containing protein n=1 Tax=Actinacidiphila soli TaxID=2487275 RepID=UPI000FCC4A03|nr:fibronectin type III domain-containing protein [Actinacidiphila soli]
MVRPARPAYSSHHRPRSKSIRLRTLPVIAATALAASFAVPTAASAAAPSHVSEGHGDTSVLAAKPYMGWSSWSLEATSYPGYGGFSWLTEAHIKQQADVMASKLKSHGYEYVNVDAGWTNGFDQYGRPIANSSTFPDGMKSLGDYVHAKGLKFGLYLAVGLDPGAYNDGKTPIYNAPGCTTADVVYPDLRKTNGWTSAYQMDFSNPCSQKYIDSVADELADWGVDFLKVDGVGPGSWQGDAAHDNTSDVKAFHTALQQTGRPIQLTLSWSLSHTQADVWKANSNGWRVDTDVECYCNSLVTWNNSVKGRWNDVVQWIPDAGPGHWNNLDALDVGVGAMDGITDTERQSYATLWAIESAPLYSGDDLTKLDSYGLSLLTNDEVIAVDQAGNPAKPVSQTSDQQVWYARNADGSYTVALFNLGAGSIDVTADFSDLGISGKASVRDLWSHKNLGSVSGSLTENLPAHGSRLFTFTPKSSSAPGTPLAVHGTASTASSVSLAWDKVNTGTSPATGYTVYANGTKVATTSGTSTTVSGLSAATDYAFTVVAHDAKGRRSVPSKAVAVTTPADGGPTGYEAEASGNTLTGSASAVDCSGCSGGKKVTNLSWGSVAVNNVTAPKDGTYLMKLDYVDGDSSRIIDITVGDKTIQVPLSGTNENTWDTAQSITVSIPLKAGSNTLTFTNPTDWAPDIDKLTV